MIWAGCDSAIQRWNPPLSHSANSSASRRELGDHLTHDVGVIADKYAILGSATDDCSSLSAEVIGKSGATLKSVKAPPLNRVFFTPEPNHLPVSKLQVVGPASSVSVTI
jgi:hypothetical protein